MASILRGVAMMLNMQRLSCLNQNKPGPIRLVDDYRQALLTLFVGVSRLMINDGYLAGTAAK